MEVKDKCEIVATSFQWWSTTADKYLQEDIWTDGRIQFVEERYSVYERVMKGLENNSYKLVVPSDVKAASHDIDFRVRMSVAVTGFRSKEYIHLFTPTDRNNLILYRTKSKGLSFPQGSLVRGKLHPHSGKTLFAGLEFPAIRKATLILKD